MMLVPSSIARMPSLAAFGVAASSGLFARSGFVRFASNGGEKETTDWVKGILADAADVNMENKMQQTPLITFTKLFDVSTVKTILEFNPDVNHADVFGNTALHYACSSYQGVEIVDLLLESGANVHHLNLNGESPLFDALHNPLFRATSLIARTHEYRFLKRQSEHVAKLLDNEFEGVPIIAHKLLKRGADINLKNKFGRPLFHIPAMAGSVELAQFFVEHGANVHAIHDKSHGTALHDAVQFGNMGTAKYLVSLGIDINAQDVNGTTPLHIASQSCFPSICEHLLEKGALPSLSDKCGRTPLHLTDCDDVASFLVQYGCDIEARDVNGRTALNTFHHGGEGLSTIPHSFSVEFLIEHGADVNTKDNEHNTPLHYAALYGMRLNMKQLLKAGADITAKNFEGKTPEQMAMTMSDKSLIHGHQL
eukprot:m.5416 g.5416  ORF g.5416 m.5416 type:complete len:423 (-) comp2401_c0_seq1:893-2161(-)